MPWFKVDDGLSSKAETTRIPRAHRRSALGVWVLAGSWSAKELTDGHIPQHMLEELSGTDEDAFWLVEAGYWTVADDGWQFVDWAPEQPLRETVLADRKQRADKMRNWRARNKPSNPATDAVTDEVTDETVTVAPSQPSPAQPSPSPSSNEEGGNGAPPRYCDRHPTGTDNPCGACQDAREARKLWDVVHAGPSVPLPPRTNEMPDCLNGRHKWAVDGTCILCPARRSAA
jgi:hypothetical protein